MSDHTTELEQMLRHRIVAMDGAMGTMNETPPGADRVGRDSQAREEQVGIAFEDHAIDIGARVALVRFDDDEFLVGLLLSDGPPLPAGGEARSPALPKFGSLHIAQYLLSREVQRAPERAIVRTRLAPHDPIQNDAAGSANFDVRLRVFREAGGCGETAPQAIEAWGLRLSL